MIEVLISTMNKKNPLELMKKMNLQNNALIINQCESFESKTIEHPDYNVRMLNYLEKGLSNSRNRAIENSIGDICLIADDDVIYDDDYKEKVKSAYELHKDADVIAFQVERIGDIRLKKFRKSVSNENYFSSMKISSVEISFRRESILKSRIKFNNHFGAGSHFYLGEESIFLYNCLKENLNVVYVPIKIGRVSMTESSWFEGYTPHLFKSIGASYYEMSKKWYIFLVIQFVSRKYKNYKHSLSFVQALKFMILGIIEYKKMKGLADGDK